MAVFLNRFDLYGYILAALFVMIGGGMMVMSGFNEEWVNKGKTTITWALVGAFLGKCAALIVDFVTLETASVPAGGDLAVSVIATLITSVLDLFQVALLGVIIYSGMRMVAARGKSEELEKARTAIIWAVFGSIVINLAKPIVDGVLAL